MLEVNPINRNTGRRLSWPLYQWDQGRSVEIRGLSLPSTPEIHYTNATMSRAYVQRATMSDTGVIVAKVPNSLLQKPYNIQAFVCIRDGDTFKTLHRFEIPVKARPQPAEYTYQYDDEFYSFETLENFIGGAQEAYSQATAAYKTALSEANAWSAAAEEVRKENITLREQYQKSILQLDTFSAMDSLYYLTDAGETYVGDKMVELDPNAYVLMVLQYVRDTTKSEKVYENTILCLATEIPTTPSQRFSTTIGGKYFYRNVSLGSKGVLISAPFYEDDDGEIQTPAYNYLVPYRIYGLKRLTEE